MFDLNPQGLVPFGIDLSKEKVTPLLCFGTIWISTLVVFLFQYSAPFAFKMRLKEDMEQAKTVISLPWSTRSSSSSGWLKSHSKFFVYTRSVARLLLVAPCQPTLVVDRVCERGYRIQLWTHCVVEGLLNCHNQSGFACALSCLMPRHCWRRLADSRPRQHSFFVWVFEGWSNIQLVQVAVCEKNRSFHFRPVNLGSWLTRYIARSIRWNFFR